MHLFSKISINSQFKKHVLHKSILKSYISLKQKYHSFCYHVQQNDNPYLLLEQKIINGRKSVSVEGPPPVATVIKSWNTFHESIDKLYQVTGYKKRYTRVAVTYRFPRRRSQELHMGWAQPKKFRG